jgi:hypothetical protein
MKTLPFLTLLSLLAFSIPNIQAATESQAAPRDPLIRQKVVGTWIVDMQSPNGTSLKGTVVIGADGQFVSKATIVRDSNRKSLQFAGTWQVQDRFLVETITSSDSSLAPTGKTTRDRIIRVNDQELVYQTEKGAIETRKRGQ